MSQELSSADIQALRSQGLLGESEIALRVGDLIVAENVVTKVRRTVNVHGILLESTRRVLKG